MSQFNNGLYIRVNTSLLTMAKFNLLGPEMCLIMCNYFLFPNLKDEIIFNILNRSFRNISVFTINPNSLFAKHGAAYFQFSAASNSIDNLFCIHKLFTPFKSVQCRRLGCGIWHYPFLDNFQPHSRGFKIFPLHCWTWIVTVSLSDIWSWWQLSQRKCCAFR